MAAENTPFNLSNFSYLVIDDQPYIRKIIRQLLAANGCRDVREASNGQEALEVMANMPPDIIICDINMEPGDGFSFLAGLRKMETSVADTPIIFLTSAADEAFVKRAIEMKVDGYMLKPISSNQLMTTLRRVVTKRIHR